MAIENEDGTVSHRCFFCGGAAHPATGHQYTARVIACWACAEEMLRWLAGWMSRKGKRRGPAFYDHVRFKADASSTR